MSQPHLISASLVFVVTWVALMSWWNAPLGRAGLIILAVAGAIAGPLWYWLFGRSMRRFARR